MDLRQEESLRSAEGGFAAAGCALALALAPVLAISLTASGSGTGTCAGTRPLTTSPGQSLQREGEISRACSHPAVTEELKEKARKFKRHKGITDEERK